MIIDDFKLLEYDQNLTKTKQNAKLSNMSKPRRTPVLFYVKTERKSKIHKLPESKIPKSKITL